MNILPTVAGLMLLFALSAAYFLQERISSELIAKSYRGFMRAERLIRNRAASKLYNAFPSTETKKKTPSSKSKETKNYISPREKLPPPEAGRFNLFPLFQGVPPEHLYDVAARFLQDLYGKCSFFSSISLDDLTYRLLDALIEKAKKNPEAVSFIDLFPQDPRLSKIFYHMLQGTSSYDLKTKKGIPPFEDFFVLDPEEQKPIAFPFASLTLLNVLFGKEVAEQIRNQEEAKWEEDHKHHPLKEADLDTLITKNTKLSLEKALLKELLSFSAGRPPLEYARQKDEKTGISVKQKVFE